MERLQVLKTYKLYIGGQFPRTESGRYLPIVNEGKTIANVCLASKKDIRNAVVAARKGHESWSSKTAYNRAQILYRIAEMLEVRASVFINELENKGAFKQNATKEVHQAIDRIVYYAGWCDKFQQFFGTVNPVASSHFNFSTPEPQGVVAVLVDSETAFLSVISAIMPAIASGNSVILVAPDSNPLPALTFAEVVNDSDVPAGTINIVSGSIEELKSTFVSHLDINALWYIGGNHALETYFEKESSVNLKRVRVYADADFETEKWDSPYMILDGIEIKTTWHPIEKIGVGGASY